LKIKNIVTSLATLAVVSSLNAELTNDELLKRIEVLEEKRAETSKLKIGGDYRFSIDNLEYKMANNKTVSNDALLTNRLWLNVNYKQDKHLEFNAKLAFNKVYGQVNTNGQAAFDSFDWFGSTTNTDGELRVKEAYINYNSDSLFNVNLPWKFGIGRRPTTYNKLLSLRDDQAADSPLGHIVSAEFDGGSLSLYLENMTGISGFCIKLAAGRGSSNIAPSVFATPNADRGENINMYSLNITTYADENLHTELQILQASNLIDITNAGYDRFGSFNPNNVDMSMINVGDITLASYMAIYNIESLSNTKVFASVAMSQTNPKDGQAMLGSVDSEIGTSFWIGTQMESLLTEGGHWGLEFNHGSEYWRSFTYSEDTVIGSKVATRGNAYELYFTESLTKGLTAQIRYTYIDYEYTGSNGFFGSQTGTPMKISDIPSTIDLAGAAVDTAQDIRFYLRYSF